MADTTKLDLYNMALRELGQKYPLANLVDVRPELTELDGAYNAAVNDVLAASDWNFARRRQTLTGVSDTAFPPHTFRYDRPTDFLRVCWIKEHAHDDNELVYSNVASGIYSDFDTVLMEYISDDAASFDPVNWDTHVVRAVVLYLAYLTSTGLARAGDDIQGKLWQQYQQQLAVAEEYEARFLVNKQISTDRLPVMRRALQFMGQTLMGSVPIETQANKLRWEMNQSWDHAVQYCLEQGAWNVQSRRVELTGGGEAMPGSTSGFIEGYSLGPADDTDTPSDGISEYEYGYILPDDFAHKIWVKHDANSVYEADHQFLNNRVYANVEPLYMEYVSKDADAVDPTQWPATFSECVSAYLALMVAPDLMIEQGRKRDSIKNTGAKENLEMLYQRKLGDAKRKDAIQQQAKPIPLGRFAQARLGSRGWHNRRGYTH